MTAYDIYKEADILIETLNSEGFTEIGRELLDVIRGGCTGSEIMMGMKYVIMKNVLYQKNISAEVKKLSRKLVDEISLALRD